MLPVMQTKQLPPVLEQTRRVSPAVTPQALAWHGGDLWMGSRDLRRIYRIDPNKWSVREEIAPPGIPWAAVSTGNEIRFTIGTDPDDDRYIWRFVPGQGFNDEGKITCPEFTGSYLSYGDGKLYLSQWYKGVILELDEKGGIRRTIEVGEEVSGHAFVDGWIYVLKGTEQNGESWRMVRLDSREEKPEIRELATVPFACRSLTYDGEKFWSNHRANNEIVAFALPQQADA